VGRFKMMVSAAAMLLTAASCANAAPLEIPSQYRGEWCATPKLGERIELKRCKEGDYKLSANKVAIEDGDCEPVKLWKMAKDRALIQVLCENPDERKGDSWLLRFDLIRKGDRLLLGIERRD
jgi:hypothetical protein